MTIEGVRLMTWIIVAYILGCGTPHLYGKLHERYWPKLQAVLREMF